MIKEEKIIVFDDVIVIPSLSPVEPSQVDLRTMVTGNIELYVPLVSSPMDTVTEHQMAVKLAKLGGIGVIHRNMSIDDQLHQVILVKETDTTSLLEDIASRGNNINLHLSGSRCKLTIEDVELYNQDEMDEILSVCRLKSRYPIKPVTGKDGRLAVGAAVSPFDLRRIKKLDGVADILVVDVAHAHNVNVLNSLSKVSRDIESDLIVGNIGTREAVLDVIAKLDKVDGLRVGISSGSICSTGEVTGAAAPTLWAVIKAREALEELGLHGKVPIIADGGIRNPADIVKSLIAGASAVMVGRMIAGTRESPSQLISVGGGVYKQYRGMASPSSTRRRYAVDRYGGNVKKVSEGVEGLVPYSGSLASVVEHVVYSLQAGLGYAGAARIRDAWKARLGLLSESAKKEIKPHDLVT